VKIAQFDYSSADEIVFNQEEEREKGKGKTER